MQIQPTRSDERYLDLLKKCLVGLVYEEGLWQPASTIDLDGTTLPIPPDIAIQMKSRLNLAAREQGKDWPFLGYTMIGLKRLDNIRHCVEAILRNDIPGDFLEAGVWRGGAAMYMKALLNAYGVTDRTVWVADSFQGMPPPTAQDFQHQQQPDLTSETYLRATQEAVEANFRRVGLMDDKVKFLKGWFKDTLHAAPVRQLALLRMDGDLYSSTMDILRALYEKVSPGGFVIADDYYAWTACKQAVTDYRQEHQITAPIQQIDWTGVFWQLPASDR